jgi:spore germination protein
VEESLLGLRYIIQDFSMFSPMLYYVSAEGSLGNYEISTRQAIIDLAREHKIPIAPTIGDESDYERIHKLIYDQSVQEKFIGQLIDEARKEDYLGWNIDIEMLESTDREAFSRFVKQLAVNLHGNNLQLFVVAYGRVEDEDYDAALAHDYQVFGEYADQVQLILFGYHNELTSPGGQTPVDWYRLALGYAVSKIPRDKILVGLSSNGYDWSNESVEGLTYPEIEQIAKTFNATASYDKQELSAVVRYEKDSETHTIYFENTQSILEKLRIARDEFGVNKFGLWRIGAEDPGVWGGIRNLDK